jgi:hypothetical protein
MNRPDDEGQREPFTSQELESLWKVLPNLLDEYGRLGQPIAKYSHSEYVTVIPNVSTKLGEQFILYCPRLQTALR